MVRLLRAWLIICLAVLWLPEAVQAHPAAGSSAGQATISVDDLPGEARDTLRAIKRGGPFAYPRDGAVFGNFERALPKHPRGYYHEYTVKTPGSRNRGARRIIGGQSGEYYYSADHYNTFRRIQE
jgi:ribonuclease T1